MKNQQTTNNAWKIDTDKKTKWEKHKKEKKNYLKKTKFLLCLPTFQSPPCCIYRVLTEVDSRATWCTFQPKLKKWKHKNKKKIHYEKIYHIFSKKFFFLYFRKMELLYFEKWNFLVPSLKNSYIFSKKISHISGGNL